MSSRSPSVERICATAVFHFAERGYDAGSLNDLAEAVGIRKASLYAHFSGKDALFMEVFSDALKIELDYVNECFSTETKAMQPGANYCSSLAKRYEDSVYLRFLLRTAYLPPSTLRDQITGGYQAYLDVLLENFERRLKAWATSSRISAKDCSLYGQAYLGIVDSLHVELIYTGGKSFAVRLKAFQRLLADSLRQSVGS